MLEILELPGFILCLYTAWTNAGIPCMQSRMQ